MKKNLKKTLAFVMVLALTLTMFSGTVFAEDERTMSFEVRTGRFDNGDVGITYGSQYVELGARESYRFRLEFNRGCPISVMTVKALPDSGYKFDEWVDDYRPESNKAEHERDIKQESFITPSFKRAKKVELTVYAVPAHGGDVEVKHEDGSKETVASGATVKVFNGEKIRLEAIPTSGADKYAFVSFGGDISETENPTEVTVGGDMEVVANFRPKVIPVIEYVVDNGDGSYCAHFGYNVRGSEDVIISVGNKNKFFGGGVSGQNAGQPITFTSGRRYDVFTVDFDGSDLSWKLDGTTVVASIKKSELRFIVRPELFANGDLVITNQNSGGDVSFNGATFESGAREIYVPCYTNGMPTKLKYEAVPDAGLDFIEWNDNNSTLNPKYETFKEAWLGTKRMVRKPDPQFETGEVMLSIVAEDHGSTSISKKIYDAGDIVDISAIGGYITADVGYVFAGFIEASADFTINEDTTLTAVFVEDDDVVLTILTDGNGTCSQSSIVYEVGSIVDLSDIIALLTPNSGYVFDEFEEVPADFYISQNTAITATFDAADSDVPKTGDDSKDLSAGWILAMILPLLLGAGYVVAKKQKQK